MDAVVLYREGTPVRIPARERFAGPKLIVATARRGTHMAKSEKDLAQATWLIAAPCESRSFQLAAALDAARDRGPKRRRALDQTLNRRPDN
jgi:hypothetical protein